MGVVRAAGQLGRATVAFGLLGTVRTKKESRKAVKYITGTS